MRIHDLYDRRSAILDFRTRLLMQLPPPQRSLSYVPISLSMSGTAKKSLTALREILGRQSIRLDLITPIRYTVLLRVFRQTRLESSHARNTPPTRLNYRVESRRRCVIGL